jgi:hypothetical protein
MSKDVSSPSTSRPEWLDTQVQGKSEGEQKLWNSAYNQVHAENHYLRSEGPAQALTRLKDQGLLPDLALDDIPKVAEQNVKAELGPKGSLHRDYYTTHDQVLSTSAEKGEVTKLVESEKKDSQAHRLAPTNEQLDSALTPQVVQKLTDAGLNTDPHQLRDGIIERMKEDKGLTSAAMEKMKSAPVGAPYVATGAVTGKQMDGIIEEQKNLRDTISKDAWMTALKDTNPDDYKLEWQAALKQTDVGALLRKHATEDPRHYDLQKIDAADSLISTLQDQQKAR